MWPRINYEKSWERFWDDCFKLSSSKVKGRVLLDSFPYLISFGFQAFRYYQARIKHSRDNLEHIFMEDMSFSSPIGRTFISWHFHRLRLDPLSASWQLLWLRKVPQTVTNTFAIHVETHLSRPSDTLPLCTNVFLSQKPRKTFGLKNVEIQTHQMVKRVSVLGCGSWGTAIVKVVADNVASSGEFYSEVTCPAYGFYLTNV